MCSVDHENASTAPPTAVFEHMILTLPDFDGNPGMASRHPPLTPGSSLCSPLFPPLLKCYVIDMAPPMTILEYGPYVVELPYGSRDKSCTRKLIFKSLFKRMSNIESVGYM